MEEIRLSKEGRDLDEELQLRKAELGKREQILSKLKEESQGLKSKLKDMEEAEDS